jgi:hypothetical protein
MSCQGNEKEYAEAQKMFVNTIWGLVAVVCSQTVVYLIGIFLTSFKLL